MDKTRLRLLQLLIAKSIAETLFVSALAVGFFYSAFPPYFHGWGEATPEAIAGWAVNNSVPWDRVEVQLFIDGHFVASEVANLSRPDVKQAGWSKDEWHGYVFALPPLAVGTHEADVYAVHESSGGLRRTLQLLGSRIYFAVDEKGHGLKR
ncbi:MAG: hypothetical protein ABJB97_00970 [Acidobacteriota bacterium]